MTTPDSIPLAALYQLLSTTLMVAVASLVKLAGSEATPMQAVLYRSVFSLLPLAAVMAWHRIRPWSPHWRLLVLRGVVGFVALCCYFYAVANAELANVMALQQLSPMFVAFLAVWLLHGRPRRLHYLLAAVCLGGAMLVVQPTRGVVSVGSALAGGSAIFSALAYVSVRALTRTEPTTRIVFWFSSVAAILAAPVTIAQGWRWPTPRANLLLIAAGLLGAGMQGFMTAGYRRAPAHVVAAFSYSTIPLGYLSGIIFWRERPSSLAHLGIALVVLGGVSLVVSLRAPHAD